MAAPNQEPTPQKLRQPARLARAAPSHGASNAAGPAQSPPSGPQPDESGPNPSDTVGEERVVLAIGSTYFHNGRVSPERYASDLAPSFLGAIAASHTLLRELFKEMGAPEGASIRADCERWHLRYGSDLNQAQFSVDEQMTTNGAGAASTAGDRTGADGWVRGLVASRDADHAQALAAFEAEAAEAAEAGAPQRAAIAYRAAGAAALAAGRGDHANRLQRLAGKAYLEIAEKSETLPQGVFMAYRESARCFLEAGNLPLAHKCLSKAIAIGETLGYTESA
ncbi:MAG TPA: hypothetical protein VMU64_05420 [Acidimicrobiales bacterium]|nr:hypothetical protein [Acidimicrobiales bacterium]